MSYSNLKLGLNNDFWYKRIGKSFQKGKNQDFFFIYSNFHRRCKKIVFFNFIYILALLRTLLGCIYFIHLLNCEKETSRLCLDLSAFCISPSVFSFNPIFVAMCMHRVCTSSILTIDKFIIKFIYDFNINSNSLIHF